MIYKEFPIKEHTWKWPGICLHRLWMYTHPRTYHPFPTSGSHSHRAGNMVWARGRTIQSLFWRRGREGIPLDTGWLRGLCQYIAGGRQAGNLWSLHRLYGVPCRRKRLRGFQNPAGLGGLIWGNGGSGLTSRIVLIAIHAKLPARYGMSRNGEMPACIPYVSWPEGPQEKTLLKETIIWRNVCDGPGMRKGEINRRI